MKNKKSSCRRWSLHKSDVTKRLKQTDSNTYSGALTDAPYGIAFMNNEWDADLPDTAVWSELLRVCKPGAHLLCFGGTKTFHRLMCQIEDAGWEIRDTLSWIYGEGMPKGLNIQKAIDKKNPPSQKNQDWDGYNTALKPAWEPIVMAMKPFNGTFAENSLEWGCGGLNIGGARKFSPRPPFSNRSEQGRWPANVMLDSSAASSLDRQSGLTKSARGKRRSKVANVGNGKTLHPFKSRFNSPEGYDDQGGASRFFYCPKASRSERAGNDHPTVKPLKLCEYLAKLILQPSDDTRLLVPYSGSGSEMIGALMAGWQHVDGIEKDKKFVATSRKRLQELDRKPQCLKEEN